MGVDSEFYLNLLSILFRLGVGVPLSQEVKIPYPGKFTKVC